MNLNTPKYTLAFCITCRNRLSHLKQTLERNMQDNYLLGKVHFVLLDYNSSDGLEHWIRTLQYYIDENILVYYKTSNPIRYLRSHSRNMCFRLADAKIVCNLDADNFLGKGFAQYLLDEFENPERQVFITSDLRLRDVVGRVCVRKEDFLKVRGYNESLEGYGMEDVDLFCRLLKLDLEQVLFDNPLFYNVVDHPDEDRVSQEFRFLNYRYIYISYVSPHCTKFLILYKNNKIEFGTLINNHLKYFNYNKYENIIDRMFDDKARVVLKSPIISGNWEEKDLNIIGLSFANLKITIKSNQPQVTIIGNVFYQLKDIEIIAQLITYISDSINFLIVKKQIQDINTLFSINKHGFGRGVVNKNFGGEIIELV